MRRFEREVQVTASMMHPHTVSIYDYGRSDDGLFFYAMEYLDGMDLERFVARFGAAPDGRVIHILRQICDSLGAAHARGLIHRDVKPSNAFLCRAGVPDLVKMLDFGLVRIADSQAVTGSGVVLGTPATMAPELFESADHASAASDIYAIGCVGYFLLTGQRVFAGASLAELCNAHLSKQPIEPSRRLGRPVDRTLELALLAACRSARRTARGRPRRWPPCWTNHPHGTAGPARTPPRSGRRTPTLPTGRPPRRRDRCRGGPSASAHGGAIGAAFPACNRLRPRSGEGRTETVMVGPE